MRFVLFLLASVWLQSFSFAQTNEHPDSTLLKQLPKAQYWRTFAKPLALEQRSLLMFQRDGTQAIMRRIDWATNTVVNTLLPEINLSKDGRYTALSSKEGLWLLGDQSLLIRPNGQKIRLQTNWNEPVAVVLADQSVLVLGSASHGGGTQQPERLQQLRLNKNQQLELIDRGLLSYDGTPNQVGKTYRQPRYGHNAVRLKDGRVMLIGGDGTAQLASIIDTQSNKAIWPITPLPSMPHERVFSSVTLLADGRVVILGASHLRCHDASEKVRSVDVYQPSTQQWSSLPSLPLVPCADAYGADSVALQSTPNGSLVVAGILEPHVLWLPSDAQQVSRYQADWLVAGNMPIRRISGMVQVLSDQEIIVAGGVDNESQDFGSCCVASAGFDRIQLTQGETTVSKVLTWVDAASARLGHKVFVAAGRRFGFTGTGQMRYSALAELIDLKTGKVLTLPNLPFASGAAQAQWLDANYILVKGRKEMADRGFSRNEDFSSYIPSSSSAMAVFDVKQKRWGPVIDMPELDFAYLIHSNATTATFLTDQQKLVRINLETKKSEVLARIERGRVDGIARQITPNHYVIAGGEVQAESISLIDETCEKEPLKNCPETYVGFGAYSPYALVENVQLADHRSQLSTLGPSQVVSSLIQADGRVWALSYYPEKNQIALARSKATQWDQLPLPPINMNAEQLASVQLLRSADPSQSKQDLIFLRQGNVGLEFTHPERKSAQFDIWMWLEKEKKWHLVLQTQDTTSRTTPQCLNVPKNYPQRLCSMAWHLREPIVWLE